MSLLNTVNGGPVLKTLYAGQKLQKLLYEDRPFLGMLAKMKEFGGDNYPLPIQHANPQGRATSISTAQANKTSSKFKKFMLTRYHDYGVASIQNEAILASRGDKAAFISLLENEIDSVYENMADTLSLDLFGTGSGKRGQISATQTLASTTIQLESPDDIVNIEPGMKLVLSATDGGGVVKASPFWVINVNRDDGSFQASATETGVATALNTLVPTVAVSDFIFVEGDYDNKFPGLLGWMPPLGPQVGDDFFGVDRTIDKTRLAGIVSDQSDLPIEEAIQKHLSRMGREGAAPKWGFLSNTKWNELNISLGSKVIYINTTLPGPAKIGFQGIQVQGPRSMVTMYADKQCPTKYGMFLSPETWKFYSLGEAPMLLDLDGNRILRESSDDASEVRLGYYGTLGCNAPGRNGVAILE